MNSPNGVKYHYDSAWCHESKQLFSLLVLPDPEGSLQLPEDCLIPLCVLQGFH